MVESPQTGEPSPIDALRPRPLPPSLANIDRSKLKEWDKKLRSLDKSAPALSDLFEVLVSQQTTMEAHAQVLGSIMEAIPQIPDATIRKLQEIAVQQRAQVQAQYAGTTAGAPQTGGGIDLGTVMSLADRVLGGGGSNPMTDLFNKWSEAVLTKELNRLSQPTTASAFEQAFEKAYVEAKAKAAAQMLVTP